MKKGRLFKRLIMILLMVGGCQLQFAAGQEMAKRSKGGETYLVDNQRGVVYNKKRGKLKGDGMLDADYVVLPNTLLSSTIKKILGMEKIKANKEMRINCIFQCGRDGQIESVRFKFPSGNVFLSVDEIAELEKALLSEKFPIHVINSEINHIAFAQCCFFYRFFE